MTDSIEGRRLHGLAEEARESGKFAEALTYTDQATLIYQKDGDLLGLAEVQSSRQSTFKHLYRHTGDTIFLALEKHAAEAAVEIAQQSDRPEATAIPYHNLGKYYMETGAYDNAADNFRKSLANFHDAQNDRHGRPSVIADIEGHLAAAEYQAGDKTALDRALKALTDLEAAEEPNAYNKNAWLSGAHLRIATMLKEDDHEEAKKHLEEARKIIESDDRLILRREQLEKTEQLLKS